MKTKKYTGYGYHGGGRKPTGRSEPLYLRVSKEALNKLDRLTHNRSEYIDNLIRQQ